MRDFAVGLAGEAAGGAASEEPHARPNIVNRNAVM